jgi:uncharacterized membrane protein
MWNCCKKIKEKITGKVNEQTKIFGCNLTFLLIMILVLASFILSAIIYSSLPSLVVTHWGIDGTANGWMPKALGAFVIPIITLVVVLLMLLLPKIDPLQKNITSFWGSYQKVVLFLALFLFVINSMIVFSAIGYYINPMFVLPIGMGLLFYFIGGLLKKTKQNYFIGVRTPWTLADSQIWDKVNQQAGKLFEVCGVIAVLGLFFGSNVIYFIILPILAVAFYSVIESYLLFKNSKKASGNTNANNTTAKRIGVSAKVKKQKSKKRK